MVELHANIDLNNGNKLSAVSSNIQPSDDSYAFPNFVENSPYEVINNCFESYYICDNNGYFSKLGEISFYPSGCRFAVIYFDLKNNEYPKTIVLDDEIYTDENNSPIVIIKLEETTGEHFIGFQNWSKPNRPFSMCGFCSFFEISSSQIKSIDVEGQTHSDIYLPSWGIKSNSGKITFVDKYGISNILNENELNSVRVEIFFNSNSKKEKIATHYLRDISEKENGVFDLSYEDVLKSWSNILLPKQYVLGENKSLDYVYTEICNQANISKQYANEETRIYFERVFIRFPHMEEASLWANITKICELSGSYVYSDENGNHIIRYGGGS